ncbi:MAG TPA: gliding motility-associated C-terminal domain-containing protein [Saprospiraceae bacterium]|nr:gliding motility-associated C-terminal domain-containing protein [Saprospiraceae bacterium]HPI04871.1 gliding motility-associated C-terminal domain-containing protein [Saprospiraceae bacterium]
MPAYTLRPKNLTVALILLLVLLTHRFAFAQPTPCGPVPDMTSTCLEACVICDIDGYTGINDDPQTGQAPPGFCTNNIHHMQWIAFIAGSTNLTITVTPSNCNTGQGLEVGIYESLNCTNFNLVSNCDGDIQQGEVGVFNNTQPLVIGQYYYFVMDGNQNDVCNYTIHVTQGSTLVPPLPPAGAVEGLSELCITETATYSIPEIVGANFYKWTLNGSVVASGPEADIQFPVAGNQQVCVIAFNVCDTVAPSCKTVTVYGPQTTNLQQEICTGDCVEIADTLICGPGNYSFLLQSVHGCDSTVNLTLFNLPVIMVDLNASICSTDSLRVGEHWYHPPGQFTEMQTSYNGCDSIIHLTLNAVICEMSGNVAVQPILCHGDHTGALTFSVLDGTPPFTYTWNRLGGSPLGTGTLSGVQMQATIANLPPGSYLIDIQDTFGNNVVLTALVADPPLLTSSFNLSDFHGYNIGCLGGQNGVVTAMPQGGTPPYAYSWSNGSTQATNSALVAGTYTVTVTDAAGCTFSGSTVLTEPPALLLSALFNDPGCAGNNTGSAQAVSVTGGVPPYLFALSGQDFGTASTFGGLTAGTYTLTVMDANGCTADTSATLVAAIIPTLNVGEDFDLPLGEAQPMDVTLNTVAQSIQWTPATGLSCTDCLEPVASPYLTTVYTLTVTSLDGCPATDSLTVRVLKVRDVFVPNAFSPNDDGKGDHFTVFAGKAVRQVKYLRVFSRWGELVFEGSDFPPNEAAYGWNGTFRGKEMDTAVFAWYAEVEFLDGEVVRMEGDLTLVR